eukprot:TRINITY_DN4458_c1_g1_i1.p1 TRINITY_DN4458_c1_g1~~TRINITY_DN4458_c1_g1_i1.p1  ORF type:complete len:490 (-),score=122.74 TRINITY_DN4458_c1_g1_i1:237-1706(-)
MEDASEPWMFLDPYDSHLDARVGRDALTVECLHEDGFQYLWKGVRANYGVTKGVFMYEVKVLEHPSVKMPETKPQHQNILRCGFSQPLTSLFLGDTAEGWGWGGTGKKSHNNDFKDYGGPFGVGDVIGCVVDMDQGSISFLKNGEFMGVAFDNIPPAAAQTGMFPHLLMKNVKCKVNFRRQDKWFDPPGPQVKFFEEALEDQVVANPVAHPETLKDCEFIQMVGLPACGKTYWAQKHMEANPIKNYVLLGTNAVIDQMKVVSLNRQRNYAERWEELISQATPIFNKLVEIAGKTPRNIILDQTNVYKNARKRKAAAFRDFGTRIACTIVNDEETLAQRTDKREREEGKFVPEAAVNQMRANFVAPELDEGFTELEWPELPEKEARDMIWTIKSEGGSWARRNPNAGSGNTPKPRLENRDASSVGKGGWKGRQDEKKNWGARDRSRSPRGGGGGKGGGGGGWGGGKGGGGWGGGGGGWGGGGGGWNRGRW